ncbi:ATP-binding protein [Lamprobacter modestohalophilus]|uniref:ATP-binding protein n=1 Tax=Lamprobacter modestohalophilus TaxID=1064514 RepID=UPI002ADEEABE|nr:ATP-binding protein [Lamprobacter modestohalophilus]MEA1050998.1 ATP-binding protein [Lamprobacter modestohalophilus]
MSEARDIDLIEDLRSNSAERPWLEFKRDNIEPEAIGKRCSALANAARLEGQDCGYLLWGIDDASHEVVGTRFDPSTFKAGNQEFQLWLAQRLQPSLAFSFRSVQHPKGRIVILEVPAANTAPLAFNNIPYLRIGSATPKLADYPERYAKLIECLRPYTWEQGIAREYATGDEVLDLLDYAQYFRLTRHPLPDNRVGIFERLQADRLIQRDVGQRWKITHLGAILFATRLDQFEPSLARKAVRLVVYSGKNRAAIVTHRLDGQRGYAAGFEGLVDYINGLVPKNEHIGSAIRESRSLFPVLAVRELVANALIHQDMTVTGAGPNIELFEDRIEISNPGRPLIQTERMIDLPPRSRNESLASLMRRMGFCEEQGSGLDKVIAAVELYQLPPPLFREGEDAMQVILYGPRRFVEMTPDERIRACYQHAVLKFLSGERMKNASLCKRFGINGSQASQASQIIRKSLEAGLIKLADAEHPRSGYVPAWA